MKRIFVRFMLTAAASALPAAAFAQTPLEGQWRNSKGSVVVQVEQCGSSWCGRVVHASEKAKAGARRGGTPNLVGTRILTGVRPVAEDVFKGQAFDPKRNVRVPATIRVVGPSTLVVRGCLIGGLLCKEQRWTRIS